jgi:hypothetical protein
MRARFHEIGQGAGPVKTSLHDILCRGAATIGAVWVLLCPAKAWAYPTAVIFSPSGKALPAYNLNAYLYGGQPLPSDSVNINPWAGLQWGVFRAPDKDSKRPAFGGLEFGVDVLGTAGGNKLVLNAKLQLLAAWGRFGPDLSIGMMQVAVSDFPRSMNFGYVVASRNLAIGGHDIGSFALGWGHSFAPSPPAGKSRAFEGSFPFRRPAREALILGYTTPSVGAFSFAVDHFGGTSEASDLYLGVNIAPAPWLLITPGAFFFLDRETGGDDGAFLNVALTIDYSTPADALQRAKSAGAQRAPLALAARGLP